MSGKLVLFRVCSPPHATRKAEFRWEHNQDAMVREAASSGIRLFAVNQRNWKTVLPPTIKPAWSDLCPVKYLATCDSCAEHGCRSKANSGYPGAPMGMADIAGVMRNDFLNITPTDRLRMTVTVFILSKSGHASMLLYSLLHLTGYDLPLEGAKKTSAGQCTLKRRVTRRYTLWQVETTTGPLGRAGECRRAGDCRAYVRHVQPAGTMIVDHYTCYVFMQATAASMEGSCMRCVRWLVLGKLIGFTITTASPLMANRRLVYRRYRQTF